MTGWQTPIGEDDLEAYVDDRLEPDRAALVASWLEEHPAAASRVATDRTLREQLRRRLAGKLEEPVPPRLRLASIQLERRRRRVRTLTRSAAMLALLILGAAAGWLGRGVLEPRVAMPALTADALAAHRTFVVDQRHPVEVDAGQEAHLVQWLSRRLGHSLVAPDLAGLGYRLIGGRLLPAQLGPAAQLMYEGEGGQRLTIYLRASPGGGETAFRSVDVDGLRAFYWVDQGFGYAVAGATDRDSLLRVAEAVFHQTDDAPPASH